MGFLFKERISENKKWESFFAAIGIIFVVLIFCFQNTQVSTDRIKNNQELKNKQIQEEKEDGCSLVESIIVANLYNYASATSSVQDFNKQQDLSNRFKTSFFITDVYRDNVAIL